jgi:alpha-ketoglutaric semialdehyde dehydrogenase
MSTVERRLNLVGGEWVGSGSDEWISVLDPADLRRTVAEVPAMDADEVAETYRAASTGQQAWGALSAIARGRVLLRAAAMLRERKTELAALITAEMGKTLIEAQIEVDKSADFFEYYGALSRLEVGEVLPHERTEVTAWTRHEPLGVVLAVTPWNDPLLTPARKLAPALAAGNAVVLKPASYTPLIGIELARVLADAGVSSGAVNTITGSGGKIGQALLDDPNVHAVSFTGSNEVGAEIEQALLGTGVRLLAELGGKNAAIVLGDADLELASTTIAAAAFAQAGQRCTATSRVIVQRSVYQDVIERLSQLARDHRIGAGAGQGTTLGPLVSSSQRASVEAFIARASDEGATLRAGGRRPGGAELQHGCFLEPTVLADVRESMEIWTEEVFGPVVAVLAVDDEAEALSALNASRYGLAASIFTRNLQAAMRFVRAADAGQVAVNLPTSGWDVHFPFGGFKESGRGHKEQGLEGLDFYRQTKMVVVA